MRSRASVAALAALLGLPQSAAGSALSDGALARDVGDDGSVGLLQTRADRPDRASSRRVPGERDLALMHIPYNFGHTVESIGMFGPGDLSAVKMSSYLSTLGGVGRVTRQASWEEANRMTRENGAVWGHLNPDLQVTSAVTGCPMYYTPQKHWPRGLAEKYFGNKTVFGLLRDPYERLVAFFRGGYEGYGGSYPQFTKTCDVNGAVKQMMKDFLAMNDTFAQGCTFVPQAEFFEGPYGISLPVDNRAFPASMNEVFVEHGYPDFQIQTTDILHVHRCPNVWAADLDSETRGLVKKFYARDFELLCEHFGYCDREENCCIWQVPGMCPPELLARGYQGSPLAAA